MSYDAWLDDESGEDGQLWDRNYTSNVSPMFERALGFSLTKLDGQRASVVALRVLHALERWDGDVSC